MRRSRVGQKLSDLTSQRVIVLILAMLIMIPGFNWNSGLYGDYNTNFVGGLSILHDAFLASGNTTGFHQVSHLYDWEADVQHPSMTIWSTMADMAKFHNKLHDSWHGFVLPLSICLCSSPGLQQQHRPPGTQLGTALRNTA